jgi:hypothetical protein
MAILTTAMKNLLAAAYAAAALYGALTSTAPGSSSGTELSGGSPAYARKALSWGSASAGAISASAATFDVASGSSVAGFQVHSAVTAGTYYDGVTLTTQAFASQGQYSVTPTYTQS